MIEFVTDIKSQPLLYEEVEYYTREGEARVRCTLTMMTQAHGGTTTYEKTADSLACHIDVEASAQRGSRVREPLFAQMEAYLRGELGA